MITVTINGKKIELEKPVTILEAAKKAGIKIPHFCQHPILELWGGCRMCVVEVEKMPRLQTACTLSVTDGMVVRTESPQIAQARKAVLEFLLINHPLECPICDKAGECKLQDYTMQYGATAGRFAEGKRKVPESLNDSLIVRNLERCILCTRCVRMCEGVQGVSALSITGRGNHSHMEPFSGEKFSCEYCGNCLTVCPVGAIMSRLHRYSYRPWQMEKQVKTVCSFCGVGCTMVLEVRGNEIKRTTPKIGLGSNRGILCNRGRFGYQYVASSGRLVTPLVRRNGKLAEASWDDALDYVAKRLSGIKDAHGGKAVSGIASARCTNEDNYLLQKLLRGLGSNNIDSIARMGYAGAQRLLDGMLGPGSTASPVSGILNSDVILAIESDPTQINPVLGVHIRMAARRGAKVITIGHMPGLKRHRRIGLFPLPRTEETALAGLIAGLKGRPLPGTNAQLEEKINALTLPSPEDAADKCKLGKDEMEAAVKELSGAASPAIVIGRETGGHTAKAALVSMLAYMLKARVYLLSERPNEQGLIDMGCLPDMLPGERPLQVESFRKKYEEAWGMDVPGEAGLTLMEIIEGAHSGAVKAMYVMGENPVFNLPDGRFVGEALGKLELLVVQDIFMTETAELAHVVLPSLAWSEKEGTYTNLERRIQHLGRALTKQGLDDWRIVAEVGIRMGLHMDYDSAESVLSEIAKVSPLYSSLSYRDIGDGFGQWPYKGEPLRDSFQFPEFSLNGSTPESGLYLMVEKPLFHSGTLSRNAAALNSIYPEAVAKINDRTAEGLTIKEGDMVNVSSEKGRLRVKAKVDPGVPESAVVLSNNFKAGGAMSLMGYRVEPGTGAPLLEGKNVKIEKVA